MTCRYSITIVVGIRTRRSIVFQLWLRLSLIAVSFTLVALTVYLWLVISDRIDAANSDATSRALSAVTPISRLLDSGAMPGERELLRARELGIMGVQFSDESGKPTGTYGDFKAEGFESVQANTASGDLMGLQVQFSDSGATAVQKDIGVLDVLWGGRYGSVHVIPSNSELFPGSVRMAMEYQGLPSEARTLLLRSAALAGAILAVAVLAMWLLLTELVAKPLREFSETATRIAAGEPLRMPDLGRNELGQLGQAINGMAEILRHQATVDSLTGLYNVRHMGDRLEDFVMESREQQQTMALLVCDVDNLKPVNDTYGHHVGDLMLKAVARHLLAWGGFDYTCWRIGGDEFAAVIPNVSPKDAEQAASVLRAALESTLLHVSGDDVKLNLSIGLAHYPADGATGNELLEVADRRMYEEKASKTGRALVAPAA